MNDERSGEGTLIYPKDPKIGNENSQYKGYWLNDKRHGYGTYTFADGSKYEGNFVNDFFSGQGKLTWAKGGSYDGNWENGV